MLEIPSNDDLRTFYRNTLAMVNGSPARIIDVVGDRSLHYKDIRSNNMGKIRYDSKVITPPPRIGFVNYDGEASYFYRRPMRKMQMGVSNGNLGRTKIRGLRYSDNGVLGIDPWILEVADAIEGKYPSVLEARRRARIFSGIVAFDKQFAVDEESAVYYKDERVGVFLREGRTIQDIKFNDQFLHLELITTGVFK
jgi:hypothetical protein